MNFYRNTNSMEPPPPCSVLSIDAPPPSPPDCPPQRLTREQLLPPTPSVHLENKKHAFSPQLQEFCLKHPIAVVRGIAAALKMGKIHISIISKKICICVPKIYFYGISFAWICQYDLKFWKIKWLFCTLVFSIPSIDQSYQIATNSDSQISSLRIYSSL